MAQAVRADVTDLASLQALLAQAEQRLGGVDIVVGNAGVNGPRGTVENTDPVRWSGAIQTDLVGAFHTAHAAIPFLRLRGNGKIIFGGSGTDRDDCNLQQIIYNRSIKTSCTTKLAAVRSSTQPNYGRLPMSDSG